MSDLKWDSAKLRRHLGAVSGNYDMVLKKRKLDPQKLRDRFYEFFDKKYKIITPSKGMKKALEEYKNECKDYMIFDLSTLHKERFDCGSCGENSVAIFLSERIRKANSLLWI